MTSRRLGPALALVLAAAFVTSTCRDRGSPAADRTEAPPVSIATVRLDAARWGLSITVAGGVEAGTPAAGQPAARGVVVASLSSGGSWTTVLEARFGVGGPVAQGLP